MLDRIVPVRVMTDPSATDPGVREGLRDPALEILISIGSSHPSETDRVSSVLLDSGIFPEQLANQEAFIADCVELGEILRRAGVRAAIREALEAVVAEEMKPTRTHRARSGASPMISDE
jgi:fructuronate reductase